jgi:hypothetical protein
MYKYLACAYKQGLPLLIGSIHSVEVVLVCSMAGPGNDPVQGFATLPDLYWEFLRLWTGFELPSSCHTLPCYATHRNRNSFCVIR